MAAVLSLLFLGGAVIRPFAIAMTIGIVVGTYSSVFIAAPTLLWLETRSRDRHGGAERSHAPEQAAPSPPPVQRASRRRKRGKRRKAGGSR
jgi:predicted RND superfamily exporter protein